jgi:sugar lactone lactonase YvrE
MVPSSSPTPPSYYITTIAGTGASGNGANNLPGPSTALNNPSGVFVSPNGLVFIADTGNHLIRMQSPSNPNNLILLSGSSSGNIDSLAGTSAKFNQPRGMCMDTMGLLYIADTGNHKIRTVNVTSSATGSLVGTTAGIVDGKGYYKSPLII